MSAALQYQEYQDVASANTASVPAPLVMVTYPKLARQLGYNEAMVISQTDYWLQRSKHTRIEDGCRWIWNSVRELLQQFEWMTRRTLERVIGKLEKIGVLLSQKFQKHHWNHTKWYRLNYQKLQEDYDWVPLGKSRQELSQSDQNCGKRFPQNDRIISEITNQRLQKPSSKTKEEEMGGIVEKDRKETGSSQQPLVTSEKLETTEPRSNQQSRATLSEKPKPQHQPKDPNQGKTFRRDVVHVPRELLENPVFIQWWINRIEKSDFRKGLYMPSEVFVKNEIRNKPEVTSDMWQYFQKEVTHRIEDINLRQERGISINSEEREEVAAIAPYSLVPLQPMPTALPSAEYAEQSLEEYIAEHRKKLEARQANNHVGPFKRGTFNNSLPSSRLLSEQEFERRKQEALRDFLNSESESPTPSTPPAPDLSASRSMDYDESEYLGTASPADFELEEVGNSE